LGQSTSGLVLLQAPLRRGRERHPEPRPARLADGHSLALDAAHSLPAGLGAERRPRLLSRATRRGANPAQPAGVGDSLALARGSARRLIPLSNGAWRQGRRAGPYSEIA